VVPSIGVAEEGDAAVGGHHQRETDQPQVISLLLRMSSLGDRYTGVGRIDVGGEVGHVQHQPGEVEVEHIDHDRGNATFDLNELSRTDGVHGMPEPPVVESTRGKVPDDPVSGRLAPPLSKGQLRTRGDHPVATRQGDVGPDTCSRALATRTDHLVDDVAYARRSSIPHTAAMSPKERCRERSGSPGPASERRWAISSALPKYS
jgi:hypothetical protein